MPWHLAMRAIHDHVNNGRNFGTDADMLYVAPIACLALLLFMDFRVIRAIYKLMFHRWATHPDKKGPQQ